MTDEQQGQIEWLESLRGAIDSGDTQVALDIIDAAVRMLERQIA